MKKQTIEKDRDFRDRDRKYDKIKEGIASVKQINQVCNEEIKRQNDYFEQLLTKVNKINREEYVTYHLRGINDMLHMSLRYAGLMLLSPFRGMIPSIAIQTLVTRNMLHNIREHLHWEEVQHVRYEAENFDSEIRRNLTDVHYVSNLISDALRDVQNLKDDFSYQYNANIPGYDDTLSQIDKIYYTILRNQNKIDKIEKNLYKGKKLNDEKLVRVREMNEH